MKTLSPTSRRRINRGVKLITLWSVCGIAIVLLLVGPGRFIYELLSWLWS